MLSVRTLVMPYGNMSYLSLVCLFDAFYILLGIPETGRGSHVSDSSGFDNASARRQLDLDEGVQ